jgi:hypothetical protein
METERKDLEWIWRGISLLALPLLGWIIQLSADLSRAQVERDDLTRRIEILEVSSRESADKLSDIKSMLKELTVSARYMASDIKALKAQQIK